MNRRKGLNDWFCKETLDGNKKERFELHGWVQNQNALNVCISGIFQNNRIISSHLWLGGYKAVDPFMPSALLSIPYIFADS